MKYIMEFIGTFLLVLTIALTSDPLAIGAILAALVYMGGYVSGAHYNPAVTIAIWMQKGIDTKQAWLYMLTQLLAALTAAAMYQALSGSVLTVSPPTDTHFVVAFLAEMIFTFALVSVVLHTAVSKKTKGNSYFGLAIGATVMTGAIAVGAISGGAFNPAVGLGANLYDINMLGQHASNLLLYIAGPVAGGIAASLLFTLTNKE